MQEATTLSSTLVTLVFLGAVVIAVPLLRFAGLSAVLGYLLAGLVIGPSGLGFFREPELLRAVAEIGIVMFLFVIGLELKPSKLLSMRRDILGLGFGHLVLTLVALAGLLALGGLGGIGLYVTGFAFALSATAIALQILEERGAMASTYGQKSFAVLLFQDMATVPVMALLPLLAGRTAAPGAQEVERHLPEIATAIGAFALLVLAGRHLLNPFFRLLAKADAREVMSAAGAEKTAVIAICIDDREAATRITEMARRAFPQAKLIVRAFDRIHALQLMERGVRSPVRETFESALAFGCDALMSLGLSDEKAEDIRQDVRRRDIQRLLRQRDEGLLGGAELLHGVTIQPAPLSEPRRKGRDISGASDQADHGTGDGTTGVSS